MNSYDAIVVTHGVCTDGSAAAWVVREYLTRQFKEQGIDTLPNIRYVFGMKRDLEKDLSSTAWKDSLGIDHPALTIDDLEGKDIWILDYMYKIEEIKRIKYRTLTIIDHHSSNKEVIEECKYLNMGIDNAVRIFFEEKYSAAGLAWRLLMKDGENSIPWWIKYIEDRDLFTFSLPHSREVNDALFNLKYRNFNKFDELQSFTDEQRERFIEQGIIIGNIKKDIIDKIVRNAHPCIFDGYKIYVVETGTLVSEVGEALYTTYKNTCDFVMCIYYDFKERSFRCRLRCDKNSSLDLSEIAKKYSSEVGKGGGHKAAAAFNYIGNIFSLLEEIPQE